MLLLECYRKPGCSLCQEADDLLRDLATDFAFRVTWHNIFDDPTWFAKYRHRVPVVTLGGQEVLELRFTSSQVRAVLGRASQ